MALPATVTVWLLDHRDGTGARITGETWDTSACRDPSGDAFTPAITEPYSDGIYQAVWAPDVAGDWLFDVQGQTDPENDDYQWSAVVAVEDTAAYPTNSDIATALLSEAVGGDAGTVGAALASLASVSITVQRAVVDDAVSLTIGDAAALSWSNAAFADAEAVSFILSANGRAVLTVSAAVTGTTASVSLSTAQTGALALSAPWYAYTYEVTADGDRIVSGDVTVST